MLEDMSPHAGVRSGVLEDMPPYAGVRSGVLVAMPPHSGLKSGYDGYAFTCRDKEWGVVDITCRSENWVLEDMPPHAGVRSGVLEWRGEMQRNLLWKVGVVESICVIAAAGT